MKPLTLIAANFVREQRWPLLLLMAWVVISSGAAGLATTRQAGLEDVLFLFKQQGIYAVAFTAFLASSAIHNERRSRRILAVLSKGIERKQYIAGLIGGVLTGAVLYCVAMGFLGGPMFERAGLSPQLLWSMVVLLIAVCTATATLTIFFSTFMPPLFSMAATGIAVGLSAVIARVQGSDFTTVLPVYFLMETVMNFSPETVLTAATWKMVTWCFADAAVLWLAASWVFSYRDVAVSVE